MLRRQSIECCRTASARRPSGALSRPMRTRAQCLQLRDGVTRFIAPSGSLWPEPEMVGEAAGGTLRVRCILSCGVPYTAQQNWPRWPSKNKRQMYDLLFRATADTLQSIAADPEHLGAEIGFFCILHSWGQALNFIPICTVSCPAAGISRTAAVGWLAVPASFAGQCPVAPFPQALPPLFGATYAAGNLQFYGDLQELSDPKKFARYLTPLHDMEWVVYAKTPFGGPDRVLDYLGRYTHRVAFSNNRLQALHHGQVTFAYLDYNHQQRHKVMTLSADEFLRRFCCMFSRILFSASVTTAFSATAIVRQTWPDAGNCSLYPCPCPFRNRNPTAGNAGNNSPGTIRSSAQSAVAAGWCGLRSSPFAGSSNRAIPHEPCTKHFHGQIAKLDATGSTEPVCLSSGLAHPNRHFQPSTVSPRHSQHRQIPELRVNFLPCH